MYEELIIRPTLAVRPGHHFVRVIADVGGYFEASQVIEVNLYEFDDTIGDENCMHMPRLGSDFHPQGTFVTETIADLETKVTDSFFQLSHSFDFNCAMNGLLIGNL